MLIYRYGGPSNHRLFPIGTTSWRINVEENRQELIIIEESSAEKCKQSDVESPESPPDTNTVTNINVRGPDHGMY